MHIHPPKPIHGWRQFFGEVGIIVLGILLALAFEQLIERAHWEHRVEKASEALRISTEDITFSAIEQQVSAPCVDQQLADLQERLTAPGAYKPAPYVAANLGPPTVIRKPTRMWSSDAWRIVTTEGVASHLPDQRRHFLETAFSSVDQMRESARQIDTLEWRLAAMAFSFQDAQTRSHLLEELSELRGRQGLLTLQAGQLLGALKAAGMLPSIKPLETELYQQSGTIAFCRSHKKPLGQIKFLPTS